MSRRLAGAVGAMALAACGSAKSASPPPIHHSDAGATCTDPNGLKIVFSPMYSAVIPGDDTHVFELPVILGGDSPAPATWTTSDTSAVSIAADPLTGGALLTMLSTATSP